MNFGPKIREIRIKKGLSQKETYSGIISKSYAIEFEKGKHSMSANFLIHVLERLNMDMDEFLFIHMDYRLSPYSSYIYRLSSYSNTHNVDSLNQLYRELSEKNTEIYRVRAAETRCRIRVIEQFKMTGIWDTTCILKEDQAFIQEYLVRIETWTLQEIQLFGNTIEFLDFHAHFPLFKNLSKSLSLYMNYDRGREIFCVMLINLISQAIKHQFLDYAEVLIQQLKLLSSDYKEFFHAAIARYFDSILLIKRGDHEQGYTEAEKILLFFRELNQQSLADELAVHIKKVSL